MRITLRELLTAVLLFGVMLALNLYIFAWALSAGSPEATVAVSTLITLDICLPGYFALEALADST